MKRVDAYFGDPRQNYAAYRKDMATMSSPANPLFCTWIYGIAYLISYEALSTVVVGGDLSKVAAMKKQVETKYGLEKLSKRQSWIFPQYLTKLQGIVRGMILLIITLEQVF